jgi:uncharacterized protein (DUF736 family)
MDGSEQAPRTARRRTAEERQPDYTVRARSGRAWAQVGAAWKPDRDGNVVLSLKINHIPVGFDGVLKVLLPLAPEDEPTDE